MPKQTVKTTMEGLLALGQSVWLDYLSRGMTRSGGLQALIDDGLRGMTSNPTIFEHAVEQSDDYDAALSTLASSSRTDRELFETLAIEDVREAADLSGRFTTRRTEGTGTSHSRSRLVWLMTRTAQWLRLAGCGTRSTAQT